jgi:PAS domain S-box-containing protein
MLGALRAKPNLESACIYRANGEILAQYSRDANATCAPPENETHVRFTRQGVIASQSIFLSGRQIGTLMLLYDLGQISERIRLYGSTVLGVMAISSLLALLLAARLRAVIATPISQLVLATTSVAQTGDYSTRAEKLSGDELGVLIDRFNNMLAGIQSRDDDLKKERERFRFLAESVPEKIFTATPQGRVDYYNGQWLPFTGFAFEQVKSWDWSQFVHPDDLDENLRLWKESISTGEPFHFEHRFRREDGKHRWHLSRAHAMRDAEGKVSMWIGSVTEIHEQKEEEEALRRANDDLQQFAFSASHDLQEPIRNVVVYSEVISRRYQKVLDAEGQLFLGFLKDGGTRLAMLINDLLAYTRAGTVEMQETPVDSSAVLQHALSSLAAAISETKAQVTYDPLPEVYMGEAHLHQVFQNLIGNALKYRDRDTPRIHVSAARRGSAWCFSVQDNGIGIDPKYKEKIFGVFTRLHHDQKYSGTGIGLAICQRVVERYGGRIWVESEPGRGSTFFFTVPRHAPSLRSTSVEPSAG